jgi:hypothetical protein
VSRPVPPTSSPCCTPAAKAGPEINFYQGSAGRLDSTLFQTIAAVLVAIKDIDSHLDTIVGRRDTISLKLTGVFDTLKNGKLDIAVRIKQDSIDKLAVDTMLRDINLTLGKMSLQLQSISTIRQLENVNKTLSNIDTTLLRGIRGR